VAKAKEKANDNGSVFVLVTTDKRGVFAGLVPEFPETVPVEMELTEARNCVYWSVETHGVFGLAVTGPGSKCKIGPAVPRLRLAGITAIAQCTPEAAEKWGAGPWSN
jgi:hypothetical protein